MIQAIPDIIREEELTKAFGNHEGSPLVEVPVSLGVIGALSTPHLAAIVLIKHLKKQSWLDAPAIQLQQRLYRILGTPDQPERKIKKTLTRTWFEQSLHPFIADMPMGAWTGTLLLDVITLFGGGKNVARIADDTVLIGLLAAAGAATTGAADFVDLDGADRRVGWLHAVLSSSATLAFLASFILRLGGKRRAGFALSTAGYFTQLFSAYVGGELNNVPKI